jgi:hypothetical protein
LNLIPISWINDYSIRIYFRRKVCKLINLVWLTLEIEMYLAAFRVFILRKEILIFDVEVQLFIRHCFII